MTRNDGRQGKACILMITAMIMMAGCAPQKQEFVYHSWPYPPVLPEIGFVGAYHGEVDFQKFSFFDKLFGATPGSVFRKPYGVVSVGDKIYVADTEGGRVFVFDTVNEKVTYIGSEGAYGLSQPMGLAYGTDGSIYVADVMWKKIFVYTIDGTPRRIIGDKEFFQNPVSVAVDDEAKRIYVADSKAHQVKVFSLSGEVLPAIGKRGGGEGEFNFPTGVAIDKSNGDLYVADAKNERVQIFDRQGKFLRTFGQPGDQMGAFGMPKSISLDSEGRVYVVDPFFHSFQVLTKTGEPNMRIGGIGIEPGRFRNPAAIYVDEKDRIYVTDSVNRRVQVFQYMSEKWKKEHPEEFKKYMNEWDSKNKQLDKEKEKDAAAGKSVK